MIYIYIYIFTIIYVCICKIFKHNLHKTEDISQKVGIYSFNMMHERRNTFFAGFFYTVESIYIYIYYNMGLKFHLSFHLRRTKPPSKLHLVLEVVGLVRGALFLPEIR